MMSNWNIVTICFILLNIQSFYMTISDSQMKFFMNKEIFEETRRKDAIHRMFFVSILVQNHQVTFNYKY